jgi:hypothetical protein
MKQHGCLYGEHFDFLSPSIQCYISLTCLCVTGQRHRSVFRDLSLPSSLGREVNGAVFIHVRVPEEVVVEHLGHPLP